MLCAAILCTKQMILTGLDSLKPLAGVPPGNYILFHTKRRNEKTVDHILRCHVQDDCAIDRHVQLVDLAFALGVLQFPHPLFSHYLHLDCIGWATLDPEISQRAPRKQSKSQNDRADSPTAFQQNRSGAWMGTVGFRPAA